MTPNFTNINLILNTLYHFSGKEFAFEFSENLRTSPDEVFLYSPQEHIQQQVKHFESIFELAEGEITHNIFAGNKIIINSLFDYIKSHRAHIYPQPDALLNKIKTWNEESYKEYENEISEKVAQYFKNEKFSGLKHLDSYEDYLPENPFDLRNFKKVIRTYHAFYCIEKKWEKYFDLEHFNKYYSFLFEQIDKLVSLFDKYLVRYDAGEFTADSQQIGESQTRREKFMKWADNNRIVVGIGIMAVILTFVVTQRENVEKIMGWVYPRGKELSGVVTDKGKNGLSGVSVIFGEHGSKSDTTDSFGRFQFANLQGDGIKTEVVHLKRSGYRDTSFAIKVNYGSEEKLEKIEIVLNVKSDLDYCIEGDVQSCYRYADAIAETCPPQEGQSRTACIFKAEMWRAVGDVYQDLLNARRDSGETSHAYEEAVHRWQHQIEMANAMPNW